MAKKHSTYRPQRRPVRFVTEHTPRPEGAEIYDREQTFEKIKSIFEVSDVAAGNDPTTVLGSVMATMRHIADSEAVDVQIDEQELSAVLPDFVYEVRQAVKSLAYEGFDFANSHAAVPAAKGLQYIDDSYKEHYGISLLAAPTTLQGIADVLINEEHIDQFMQDGVEFAIKVRLVRTYMSSRRVAKATAGLRYDDPNMQGAIDMTNGRLQQRIARNPNEVHRETTAALSFLMSEQVSNFLQEFNLESSDDRPAHTNDAEPAALPHMELDFSILPPGQGLEEYVRYIEGNAGEHEKARIDLGRIGVLEKVRELWGKDACYFAHGKPTGLQMHDVETDTTVDEDYIVLVMTRLDTQGGVIGEHALAISPIARKHAAYLTRYDVSAGTWREVLPLPKTDARDVGARGLKFTASTGRLPYEMMTEKVRALLDCPPQDFHNQLRMRADGSYRVQSPRDMGSVATKLLA